MLEQQNSGNTNNNKITQERKENAIRILEKANGKQENMFIVTTGEHMMIQRK